MPRDILIYGRIHEYSTLYFFDQLAKAQAEEPGTDLILRVNTSGGDPQYGMSLITKIQELENAKILVEGAAHSMGLFMLCYLDDAEAIETAQAVLHRAAYSEWMEKSEGFQQSVYYPMLVKTNKDLEKSFRAKVDVEALEALPQMTQNEWKLKDIFSLESRNEILLSAADMKRVGLIKSIVKITPTKEAKLKSMADAFEKCESLKDYRMAAEATTEYEKPKKEKIMTLEELKAQHPAIYAQAFAEGVNKERDRVEAWMTFADIDAAAVTKGVSEGKDITAKAMAEFTRKGMSAEALKKVEEEGAANVTTSEAGKAAVTAAEKELESFDKSIEAEMKRQKLIA